MFLLCKNCYVRKTYIYFSQNHRTLWPNLTKFNKFTKSNYLKGRLYIPKECPKYRNTYAVYSVHFTFAGVVWKRSQQRAGRRSGARTAPWIRRRKSRCLLLLSPNAKCPKKCPKSILNKCPKKMSQKVSKKSVLKTVKKGQKSVLKMKCPRKSFPPAK